jgi:hypothetical protein
VPLTGLESGDMALTFESATTVQVLRDGEPVR